MRRGRAIAHDEGWSSGNDNGRFALWSFKPPSVEPRVKWGRLTDELAVEDCLRYRVAVVLTDAAAALNLHFDSPWGRTVPQEGVQVSGLARGTPLRGELAAPVDDWVPLYQGQGPAGQITGGGAPQDARLECVLVMVGARRAQCLPRLAKDVIMLAASVASDVTSTSRWPVAVTQVSRCRLLSPFLPSLPTCSRTSFAFARPTSRPSRRSDQPAMVDNMGYARRAGRSAADTMADTREGTGRGRFSRPGQR